MAMNYGVNLNGAEFGPSSLPGTYGTHYTYPTHAELDYFAGKGMEMVRLPFKWERVQHTANGPLDAAELARIDDIVDYAKTKGLTVAFDLHNYGKYYGSLVGVSGGVPNAAFADVWGKLAAHFKDDTNVQFGLMNEPNQQNATQWIASANAAIDAIRDAGAAQKILVPGTYWDGAWSWVSTDNDTVVGKGVVDRLDNYAFEVHQYLDDDHAGDTDQVVSPTIGSERLKAATEWARTNGEQMFLGEFGVGTGSTSLAALEDMLDYLDANADVWAGATYWAAGPWWSSPPASYEFWVIEPQNGVDRPQMDVMEPHLVGSGTEPPPPPPPPPDGGTMEVGTGPDTLKLLIAGDYHQGEPTFTVKVDGVQVGGVLEATADKAQGEWQTFNVHGDWATGSHSVVVTFANDLDARAVHIGDGATFNGAAVTGEVATLATNGSHTFSVSDAATPPPPPPPPPPDGNVTATTNIGTGPDKLVLRMNQDYYKGDAKFELRVDNQKIASGLSANADHRDGEIELFNISGNWGPGSHTANIRYYNDLTDSGGDRNIYLESAAYNGAELSGDTFALTTNSNRNLAFTDLG